MHGQVTKCMGQEARSCRCWAKTPGNAERSPRRNISVLQGRGGGVRRGRFLDLLRRWNQLCCYGLGCKRKRGQGGGVAGPGEPVALYMGAGVGVGIDPGISLAGCRQMDGHKDYVRLVSPSHLGQPPGAHPVE